ncbi:MAG: anhydro-N-acetylmuramic acid kinase [Gammaproteobacteria bacterium]|nr:anhydro-N-acetylmuramic acid kinase [Gammaproteobacteria bacterium]MDD9807150.1 anhydro-N-acetylmuramic acid kinase [Gammaproteobacteria bacterium]
MPAIYLGALSGTSLDSVDVAAVDFDGGATLIAFASRPIDRAVAQRITNLQSGHAPLSELARLDCELGHLFADAVLGLIEDQSLAAGAIEAVGLHGQTLLHRPDDDCPYSVQIGDPNIVAARTGLTTVADFRRADIALGGQGAPLTPAFHRELFGHIERAAIVNIGGIANLTVLGGGEVAGFDTGPGNCLMDAWTMRHRQQPFDDEGRWAAGASPDRDLLARLLDHPPFSAPPPKSFCTSQFPVGWLEEYLEDGADPAAVQATLAELTAATITDAVRRHAAAAETLLVCGGGVRNRHLMQRLSALIGIRVCSTEAEGVPPDRVEALAFAWLARQRLARASGVIPAATGARQAALLGAVYRPPPQGAGQEA